MLWVAALLAPVAPCPPASIAAAASVSVAAEQDFAAVGLSGADTGFRRPTTQIVRWRGPCTPTIVRLVGGRTLVTASGLALVPGENRLDIREGRIRSAEEEPPHPNWRGRRFIGSASLSAGTWRVGAWARSSGVTDLARYRPGVDAAPIPMLTSARPLLGLSYLGAPDSIGGTLFFAQRLGPGQFRMVSVSWSEAGLRPTTR